ncbi:MULTISPECIES: DUF3558 domain-containing protein [Mycolicibacterium]|uniref:Lipoprotein LprB n=1 Tax=Mycolicibacterium mageritense TaxID=53462 RepID=A0AAI8XKV2_MYCME|nr:DUF3558 domain-containing protein [Mycolicibacterium mageritense]MBN3455719.1 DUF3558 domain-containing protein [Mycobacterium sp. DSM 3803]BDY26170.1 Putative lipoprotein LprB [Mycolicibacterium mageritense]
MHGVTPSTAATGWTRGARTLAVLAAAVVPVFAACSTDEPTSPDVPQTGAPTAGASKHGPFFPQCGGVTDQTVSELTQVPGLVNTATNSSGCQWLQNGSIAGPHFSFTWFRGSPIGRERKTEELSRTKVEDINIEGHGGFIALGGDILKPDEINLCEIGIQFDDDFIEWSISFNQKPYPDPCEVAKELTRQSIVNSK